MCDRPFQLIVAEPIELDEQYPRPPCLSCGQPQQAPQPFTAVKSPPETSDVSFQIEQSISAPKICPKLRLDFTILPHAFRAREGNSRRLPEFAWLNGSGGWVEFLPSNEIWADRLFTPGGGDGFHSRERQISVCFFLSEMYNAGQGMNLHGCVQVEMSGND